MLLLEGANLMDMLCSFVRPKASLDQPMRQQVYEPSQHGSLTTRNLRRRDNCSFWETLRVDTRMSPVSEFGIWIEKVPPRSSKVVGVYVERHGKLG